MVQVEAVRDRESFEAWLEALPENERTETAAITASRAVLRVFPIWAMLQSSTDFLPLVRTLLVSVVASEFQIPEIKEAARIARDASRAAENAVKVKLPPKGSDGAAYATARKAVSAAAFDAAATAFSNESVVRAVRAMDLTADAADLANAYSASWTALRSDLEATLARENILHHPLWPEGSVPKQLQKVWSLGRASMQDNFGYSFWIRWYEAILAGRPLTGDWQSHWQLMHDIALIAPEDWDKGAEHLAGVVDLITQKHALQRDVAQIKRALENEIFNAETLGLHRDNLPDDLPPSRVVQYRAQLREVQEELEAVEAALEPPVPDAEVLEEATGRLHAAWERFKAICTAIGIATALGGSIYLQGAIDQAGARSMDWLLDEGAPSLIQSLRSVSPKPSPAAQASRNARGERVPDKR